MKYLIFIEIFIIASTALLATPVLEATNKHTVEKQRTINYIQIILSIITLACYIIYTI